MFVSKVKDIVTRGFVGGNPATFRIKKNRFGRYELGKVIGRKPGTRANDSVNKVQVNTLEEVASLLSMSRDGKPYYYVWLTYNDGKGLHRRNQYCPNSVEVIWSQEFVR